MSILDRRLDADRAIIDDELFVRAVGERARTCAICEATIAGGEERWVPIRAQARKKMVHGRRTRLCVPCVEGRIAKAAARSAA